MDAAVPTLPFAANAAARFDEILDWALPVTYALARRVEASGTAAAYPVAVESLVRDKPLASSILRLAVAARERGLDNALQLSLLAHLLIGLCFARNPRTQRTPLARFALAARAMPSAVVGLLGSSYVKRGISAAGRGVKSAAKATGRAAQDIAEGAQDVAEDAWDVTKDVSRDTWEKAKGGVEWAQKQVFRAIGLSKQAVFWAIRQVFGERVGGFLVNALQIMLSMNNLPLATLVGLLKSLQALYLKGDPKKALKTFLEAVTGLIIGPAILSLGMTAGIRAGKLNAFIEETKKKNPWLALQLVSLLFSVETAAAAPQAFALQVIAILRPTLSSFLKAFGGRAGRLAAKAVDVGCTILTMAAAGAGSIKDIATTAAMRAGVRAQNVIQKFSERMERAFDELANFRLGKFAAYFGRAMQLLDGRDVGKAQGTLAAKPISLATPEGRAAIAAKLAENPKYAREVLARLVAHRRARQAIWSDPPPDDLAAMATATG